MPQVISVPDLDRDKVTDSEIDAAVSKSLHIYICLYIYIYIYIYKTKEYASKTPQYLG